MPIVVRSRQAAIDLAEIARYIANDDPIAAHRWLEEMHELFALIATQPAIGEEMTSSRHGPIRRHIYSSPLRHLLPNRSGRNRGAACGAWSARPARFDLSGPPLD